MPGGDRQFKSVAGFRNHWNDQRIEPATQQEERQRDRMCAWPSVAEKNNRSLWPRTLSPEMNANGSSSGLSPA